MNFDGLLMPTPLWLEYTRIKQAVAAQKRPLSPNLDLSQMSMYSNSLTTPAPPVDVPQVTVNTSKLNISLFRESDEIEAQDFDHRIKQSLLSKKRPKAETPLKRSIASLKKSVEDLKVSSKAIYHSLSGLSNTSRASLSSPTPREMVKTRMTRIKPRSYTQPAVLTDTGTQIDPGLAQIPTGETSESMRKLSFSIMDGKRDLTPFLVAEEEDTVRSYVEEAASTAGSAATPSKFRGSGQKIDPVWPSEMSIKRSNTSECLTSSAERRKSVAYYIKVNNVNGRYYDATGQELVLGKTTNQGISLKGKETNGGFRLFASAQECMNCDTQQLSPRKGSRTCMMKVTASGPSLR